MPIHTTLISAAELRDALPAPFILDCSHDLADPEAGARAWAAGHIPGAQHIHLDRELASPPGGGNGRHPLPERTVLAARLAALGLRRGQQVVAYDRSQGMYAARLWWLLRWLGHAEVALLDGGWQAWTAAGGAVETAAPAPRAAGDFVAGTALVGSVDVGDVLANLQTRARLVADARAPERYAGEGLALDPVSGHIPGAVCRFFRDNLQPDGCFKPAATLRAEWQAVLGARGANELISQCGSGVTACHNLLALEIAGLPGALLYPGSWSEWSADAARPVARGMQPG